MRDRLIIGKGHNMALLPNRCCLKDSVKGYVIGSNPSLCSAIHAEWMALLDALSRLRSVEGSTLYIIGRHLDGGLWSSNFFACTVCARLLYFAGVKEIKGKQFTSFETLSIDKALANSIEHIILTIKKEEAGEG